MDKMGCRGVVTERYTRLSVPCVVIRVTDGTPQSATEVAVVGGADLDALIAERDALAKERLVLRASLVMAANYVESGADIIIEQGGDEEDDRDARAKVAEWRALANPEPRHV